jgi:stage II sporulation protein D
MRWIAVATATLVAMLAVSLHSQSPRLREDAAARQAAYFLRGLDDPRDRREARADILDTPVFPGSIVKTVALVAALERGIITANSSHICRRVTNADGQTFTCSHPDLKRPLTPAEALAYSCNDFFVSLAPRLPREALNATRMAAGLPPIASTTLMSTAIVGLAGPKTSPRALIDVLARLTGAGKDKPVVMKPATKAVLLEGLRGAADYGTASAFKTAGVSAMAKTGTILMPSGAALGLVVALTPADKPTRAIVVAAPGAAGLDAAKIAASLTGGRDHLEAPGPNQQRSGRSQPPIGRGPNPHDGPDPLIRLGRTRPDGSVRVENIALDAYIAQVLAGEGQPTAGDGAQQALAITARTFALANHNRHRKEGFDLCDTTHCQVTKPATAVTRHAAEATSGRVLMHQGQPAFVFYSAWCGGKSELASQVWPGAIDYSYEPALDDDACEDEPGWVTEVRVDQIERALRAAGLRGSRLRNVRVLSRNTSERVARVSVEGFTPAEMSGHEFRMAVGRVAGWQSIKSTAFDIDRTSTGYRFKGRGFGHGVGLCVIGAGRRAAKGATADDILKFYFPGLIIGNVGSSVSSTSASARANSTELRRDAAVAPSGRDSGDVALALPGNEEGERPMVMSIVRRSRDEVAKLTGTLAPSRLRITVHPSVESFGRATGQPWWVSGATDGPAIDLLPITVLRRQGQIDRTIRHEVVHALLDGALAKRPMWVREGAAAYFSNPAGAKVSKPDRVQCPSDIELLRPASAGAQRDAYARAEACFARAIAEGKRWDQVR